MAIILPNTRNSLGVPNRYNDLASAGLRWTPQEYASYGITVTAGQTHAIQSLVVALTTVVDWGDGYQQEITGSGTRTRVYASSGSYTVKIMQPENVTTFNLRDNNANPVINSAWLKQLVNVETFTIDSLPNATITIAPGSFSGYTTCNNFTFQNCNLTQPQINTILADLYAAAITPRTATGGTISLYGQFDAAPSGTLQPATSCPVTSATPGREIAYELKNDSCGAGFNKWATVNIN